MTEATIRVFSELDGSRELIRTIRVETGSAKPLNGSRALKVLRSNFPELGAIYSLQKTDDGWIFSRAVEPKPNCSFHYRWERYCVS